MVNVLILMVQYYIYCFVDIMCRLILNLPLFPLLSEKGSSTVALLNKVRDAILVVARDRGGSGQYII